VGLKLSYSANNKYKQSPMAWFLHYTLRLREERMGSALAFGSAMDKALNTLLENKRDSKNASASNTFIETFEFIEYNGEKLDLKTSEKIKWLKSDLDTDVLIDEDQTLLDKAYKAEWVCMRRKGLLMIAAYEIQVMPHIKEVVSIQDYVSIPNEEGDEVIGYIDFVAKFFVDESVPGAPLHLTKYNDKIITFDNKTSSMTYKADSVQKSDQLGTYFEWQGNKSDFAGYIVIPKKIRKQKLPLIPIDIIIDEVAPEVREATFQSYSDTINGIKTGEFQCYGDKCRKSMFGCCYATYCASNGKDTTGLVQVPDSIKK